MVGLRPQVQDRDAVLRSCLERVPDSQTAARLLLEYGLRQTNVDEYVHVVEVDSLLQALTGRDAATV